MNVRTNFNWNLRKFALHATETRFYQVTVSALLEDADIFHIMRDWSMSEQRKSACMCTYVHGCAGTNIDPGVKRSITTRAIKHRRVCDRTWPTLHLVKIALDRRGGKRCRAPDGRRLRICTTLKNVSTVSDNRDAALGLHLKAEPAKRRGGCYSRGMGWGQWERCLPGELCSVIFPVEGMREVKLLIKSHHDDSAGNTLLVDILEECKRFMSTSPELLPVLRFLSCICRMLLIGNPDSFQSRIQNINIPWTSI